MTILWLSVLAMLLLLSARSALVLRGPSPWTKAGWWLCSVYAIAAAAHLLIAAIGPAIEYTPLVLLTIAFVIAGVRDEPQAEPWWWPRGPGETGAVRKARRKASKP